MGRMDGPRGQRDGRRSAQKARARSRRRLAGGLVATILLVGILFVGVFPTRTYLAQRAATHSSEAQLAQVRKDRAAVEAERDKLKSDAELERRAREDFGYVKKGEESYNILPKPTEPLGLPDGWPFTDVERAVAAG